MGEGANGRLLFNGHRVWDDEKALEMGSADVCTAM